MIKTKPTAPDEPSALMELMAAVERNHAEQDAADELAAQERRELRRMQDDVRKSLEMAPFVHRRGGRSNGKWDHERVYGNAPAAQGRGK